MLQGVTPDWLRSMFSRIARRYDLANTLISGGLDGLWRRHIARRVAQHGKGAVLDIACGTGGVLYHIARHCDASLPLHGVDFTEAMLRVARQRWQQKRLSPQATFCLGDALQLPYATSCFDVVTMMFGVRNFAQPAQGLEECYRVLRPGGYLCLVEFSWPRHRGFRLVYSGYFRYLLPLIAWPLCGERSAYRYLRDSVMAFRSQGNLPSLLQEAGFRHLVATPLSGGITTLYEGWKLA